jgi:predicted kinase
MSKIILCRGIQGSGKTTWAKDWVKEFPVNRIRINNDDIRNMLGPYWIPSRENIVSFIKHKTAVAAMAHGYDIVVDNMNLNLKEVKFWKDIIDNHNKDTEGISPDWIKYEYEIEFKDFFNISLQDCIERDSKRPNPIGEEVIRKTYEKYKHIIEK